ncbi:hypothetical protein TPE_0684 [Treponema pedis str. T A4]|uniref:Uncharacterized protein n=1 Tax=Treponema pedis str. T A4 TaxID=1291379 RepID=S5ZSU2_9SPIR|nr:hypothetical protein TPE_0684 [Treponema pedis str. T A4]
MSKNQIIFGIISLFKKKSNHNFMATGVISWPIISLFKKKSNHN